MKLDIGNYHTEEQVGTIDDEGNLETESDALEEVARPFIEDGIHSVFPFSAEDDTGGEAVMYREFHIEPGDEGWLREFFDALPSPYDCDMDVLGDLPTFDPEERAKEKLDKSDFPPWCRSCGDKRRMSGSFVCPTCHPDKDEDEYSGALAGDKPEEKDNAVTTGDAGYSNAVYGGVSGNTLDSDHWESSYMDVSKRKEIAKTWAKSEYDYADVDDMMLEAFKNSVWWQPDEDEDLSKAPNMWEHASNVPEFVKEFIREAISQGVIWDQFEDIPKAAILKVEELFRENLTQPQGWSVHSLTEDLSDEFASLSRKQAETIARNETAAIMNTAREEAYKSRPDEDEYEYYWSNPQDHRTTDVCNEIIEEIESQGGAVDLPTLKDILLDKAQKYANDPDNGGTPQRVDEWLPHFECRSTFVREVYL